MCIMLARTSGDVYEGGLEDKLLQQNAKSTIRSKNIKLSTKTAVPLERNFGLPELAVAGV